MSHDTALQDPATAAPHAAAPQSPLPELAEAPRAPSLPPPAPSSPPPRLTFHDLVTMLATIDQIDELPEFDPAQVVGDLRDKVDNIYYVIQRMEGVVGFLKAYVDPINRKRASIERGRERLRDYVARTMRGDYLPEGQRQRMEQVPGNAYFVRLRDSPPSLKITRPATALDYQAFPQYVEMRREYAWKTDAVKDDILAGKLIAVKPGQVVDVGEDQIPRCDFAEVTRGVWPEFRVKVPEVLEKPKKQRKGGASS